MKKNGFTLIEITATVLILALLSVFIVPKVNTIINNNKAKMCNSIVVTIEDAAKTYTYKNVNIVDKVINVNGYFEVSLLTLQQQGLLNVKLENPYTNEQIYVNNVVRIEKTGNSYSYTYMGDDCK